MDITTIIIALGCAPCMWHADVTDLSGMGGSAGSFQRDLQVISKFSLCPCAVMQQVVRLVKGFTFRKSA